MPGGPLAGGPPPLLLPHLPGRAQHRLLLLRPRRPPRRPRPLPHQHPQEQAPPEAQGQKEEVVFIFILFYISYPGGTWILAAALWPRHSYQRWAGFREQLVHTETNQQKLFHNFTDDVNNDVDVADVSIKFTKKIVQTSLQK